MKYEKPELEELELELEGPFLLANSVEADRDENDVENEDDWA